MFTNKNNCIKIQYKNSTYYKLKAIRVKILQKPKVQSYLGPPLEQRHAEAPEPGAGGPVEGGEAVPIHDPPVGPQLQQVARDALVLTTGQQEGRPASQQQGHQISDRRKKDKIPAKLNQDHGGTSCILNSKCSCWHGTNI